MPKRDLTFEAIRLLSQRIVGDPNKIPEGPLFQRTSCMNPEDAETVGTLIAAKEFLADKDPEFNAFMDKAIKFLEQLGISKWVKGELTHLGFRAGLRYQENIDLAEDNEVVDEADIAANSSSSS